VTSTLSRAKIPKYVLNFILWGPSALPVAGSMLTTGLSAPGGIVAKDHSCVTLRVRFWVDGDTAATAGGRGEAEGGGGETGGVAMVL